MFMEIDQSDRQTNIINVCLATRLYPPFYAGGALRFKRYLPGLAVRQIQTRVFTGTPSRGHLEASKVSVHWQTVPVGAYLPAETIDAIPVHRVRLPDAGSRKRITIYCRSLTDFCQQPEYQPDLIQFLPLPFWAVPWLLKLRRANVPMVMAYNLFENFSHHPVKRAIQQHLWRLPFQIVDNVVVNSNAMRDNLRNLGITTPIRVIPNGVDLTRFQPSNNDQIRQEIRRSLGINLNDKLVITVGAVEPRKGIDLLLQAWIRLATKYPDAHLVIVGPRTDLTNPAYEAFHRKLGNLLAAASMPSQIHFVGQVKHVEKYLLAADIFAFASLREGFPNVVLEAMATGLPVVTAPFIGLSEELGQANEHFLLADHSPDSFSEVLDRLIRTPSLQQQMGQSARNWVMTHMDMEQSLDQYTALYREMARSSARAPVSVQ